MGDPEAASLKGELHRVGRRILADGDSLNLRHVWLTSERAEPESFTIDYIGRDLAALHDLDLREQHVGFPADHTLPGICRAFASDLGPRVREPNHGFRSIVRWSGEDQVGGGTSEHRNRAEDDPDLSPEK